MRLGIKTLTCVIAALVTANVGHAATWYVGPGGTGTGTSAASPVGSINAAYQKANAGDEIHVLSGSYGDQQILSRATANSWATNVTVKPAPGANPVFTDQVEVMGAHLTFSGFNFDHWFASRAGSDYLILENSTLKGGTSFNSDHNTIRNNRFVDGQNVDAVRIQGASSLGRPSTGTIFEGNYIKNYRRTDSSSHVDNIQIINASNIIIRNNRMSFDGTAAGILFTPSVGPVFNVLIENNFMVHGAAGLGNGGRLLNLGDTSVYGVSLINNTLIGSVGMGKGPRNDNVALNNIFARFTADSVANQPIHKNNYIYESIFNITLDPTDKLAVGAMPSFANVSDMDLHITAANTVNLAIGGNTVTTPSPNVRTVGAPLYDIDGELRTSPIWVGADQFGAFIPEPTAGVLSVFAIGGALLCRRRASY